MRTRLPLDERRAMLQHLFDPEQFEQARAKPKPRRLFPLGTPGSRLRRDQRALRKGLRLCGVCKGRGQSQNAACRTQYDFYVYMRIERWEFDQRQQSMWTVTNWTRADGSKIPNEIPRPDHEHLPGARVPMSAIEDRPDDVAYVEIPWTLARIACWACKGSGFNCSPEMARAIEERCHTSTRPSTPTEKGASL